MRRLATAGLALVLIVAPLAGCGGGSSSSTSASPGESQGEPAAWEKFVAISVAAKFPATTEELLSEACPDSSTPELMDRARQIESERPSLSSRRWNAEIEAIC